MKDRATEPKGMVAHLLNTNAVFAVPTWLDMILVRTDVSLHTRVKGRG